MSLSLIWTFNISLGFLRCKHLFNVRVIFKIHISLFWKPLIWIPLLSDLNIYMSVCLIQTSLQYIYVRATSLVVVITEKFSVFRKACCLQYNVLICDSTICMQDKTCHVYFLFSLSTHLPTGQLSNVPWRRTGVKYANNEVSGSFYFMSLKSF